MNDDLERATRQALQGLPDMQAPAALEARVLQALAAHSALPWWRLSFREWPSTPRVAFLLLTLALIALAVQFGAGARLSAAPAEWLARADGAITSIGGFFALVERIIPPGWLTAALTLSAALYTTLFGLGAVLYRFLYLKVPVKDGML